MKKILIILLLISSTISAQTIILKSLNKKIDKLNTNSIVSMDANVIIKINFNNDRRTGKIKLSNGTFYKFAPLSKPLDNVYMFSATEKNNELCIIQLITLSDDLIAFEISYKKTVVTYYCEIVQINYKG